MLNKYAPIAWGNFGYSRSWASKKIVTEQVETHVMKMSNARDNLSISSMQRGVKIPDSTRYAEEIPAYES